MLRPAALRAFLSHASVVTGHGQRGALTFCAVAFSQGWRSRASRSPPRGVGVARVAQWCRALSSLVPASKASGPSNTSNLSKPSSPSSPLHGLSGLSRSVFKRRQCFNPNSLGPHDRCGPSALDTPVSGRSVAVVGPHNRCGPSALDTPLSGRSVAVVDPHNRWGSSTLDTPF